MYSQGQIELWTKAVNIGRQTAIKCGGDWRLYTKEIFLKLQMAESIVNEVRLKRPDEWASMTKEEKSEVSAQAIRAIHDRAEVQKYYDRLN
jgi:hypothetical protein